MTTSSSNHGAYYSVHRDRVSLDEARLANLRPGQEGAVYAMRGWATAADDDVALLVLPTGYGKSELIALAPFLFSSRRVLVIAPSIIVRHQLATRMRAQEHLRRLGILPPDLPEPSVCEHVGQIESADDWKAFDAYDVVVSHTQSVSPTGRAVADPPDPTLFDLLIFDEAHHLGAPTWAGVREAFPDAAAIGFTATPYRRDRRLLPGRTIFQYSIGKAVDEGFFVPIVYREVAAEATQDGRDLRVAEAAIQELRQRDAVASRPAARLLVRADTVDRARSLAALYGRLDREVVLEVITHETTPPELRESTSRLHSGESSGVAFVGVLGEGFDLPSLKIAAYHNPHRSLPVTIQFAGRVARTERGTDATGDDREQAVLIATLGDHPEILAELHKDGQRWDRLIPELAKELAADARAWTMFAPDTAGMAEAFSIENFRSFLLADVYRLHVVPSTDDLAEALTVLAVHTPTAGSNVPHDSARSVKVLRAGTSFAVLFSRLRQLQWLDETPSYSEYEYMVLALEQHVSDGSWWLCVRSTLPADMTQQALDGLFGAHLGRPSRTELARYRSAAWAQARFTGLGKRAIHPVVAGVLSYETGAGRGVDQALTLDDRALHEAGHAIGVVTGAAKPVQIGIAMDKRRVWQVGYASLGEYATWAASVCRDLERTGSVSQLGGLRIADSDLAPDAKPIAALLDPAFDPTWDATFHHGVHVFDFHELMLEPEPRANGDDITLRVSAQNAVIATLKYADDGRLLEAPGEYHRRGRAESLAARLERYPISVFFADGSVLRGSAGSISALDDGQYFPISTTPRSITSAPTALGAGNRFLVLAGNDTLLPEKNARAPKAIIAAVQNVTASTVPQSLFQLAVSQAVSETPDFIFCDDGANEVADFIVGWAHHPVIGGPHLRLVHCKAMDRKERKRLRAGGTGVQKSSVKVAEEVSQQALRSVAFLLLSPDSMVARLEHRAANMPSRYIRGTIDTFRTVATSSPTSRTSEIWVLHPGLSHSRLLGARGRQLRTLLSAVRVRAVDARADLAVVGRA